MANYINFLGGIIFTIIILIFYTISNKNIYDKLISGFYEADASFCEESEIDMFCIYFDEDIEFNNSRPCYILAKKDNKIIINEPTLVKLSLKWNYLSNYSTNPDTVKIFNVIFEDISDDVCEVFPKNQTMRYYPIIGKIVLYNDDEITACLYKNGMNSELKSIMKEADENEDEYDEYDEYDDDDDKIYD